MNYDRAHVLNKRQGQCTHTNGEVIETRTEIATQINDPDMRTWNTEQFTLLYIHSLHPHAISTVSSTLLGLMRPPKTITLVSNVATYGLSLGCFKWPMQCYSFGCALY